VAYILLVDGSETLSYLEVISFIIYAKWIVAMSKEIGSLSRSLK